jgi:YidC/Oxa1 family membrane protein insertase
MISFFKTVVYIPLYNVLSLLLSISWIDAGVAVILLTLLVKLILHPLSKKSAATQIRMREKEGELKSIKEKYKDKQEQAAKMMEFYKTHNINPFSGIFTLIIQIPIIYSLYYMFYRGGLPDIDPNLLYSFVKVPDSVSMVFLGLVDISEKSVLLALLAAVTSYLQMHLSSQNKDGEMRPGNLNSKEDLSKMMMKQMKYTMPVMVFFISWQISGVIALYWFTSNVLGIIQDWHIKKQLKAAPA